MSDPISSYATASIALRVSGALKPHHHDKVETPLVGLLLGYSAIDEAVFSVWSEPGNSRTKELCNPFLSNGTVNTFTIIGVLYGVRAEGL
jgi:hypothetical protein